MLLTREFLQQNKVTGLTTAGCLLILTASWQCASKEQQPERQTLALPTFDASEQRFDKEVMEYAARLQSAYRLDETTAQRYSAYIIESASYSGVPRELLAALIHTESHFRDQAVSVVGAVGPAQIMPRLWEEACGDVHEPRTNVLCAGLVLKHYQEQFCRDDSAPYACALSHYNVGPGTLRRQPERGQAAANRYLNKMNYALSAYDGVMDELTMDEERLLFADLL
ncbi:transglycosylase SLT domain-containing protein [Ferrimonas marina]|uniref:Transglycosylase SLT domain-containing protein n=1 Tax=Ferrimonas marina TaxID=299255 RepID=A0A1M5NW73_9GAMM|nr:transglycosylase SLT domain-containing protein [Ferrimonas marina]SHG93705.1 Transglycosylase SLT domain-containing protein [Ferrimonas marina]